MKTLQEQIQDRCIHFTGLQNEKCGKDICYKVVKVEGSPINYPCVKNGPMFGGRCDVSEFPTEEQVKEQIAEINNHTEYTLKAIRRIKSDNKMSGVVECPKCEHLLNYRVALSNGHIHAQCTNKECDISFMQ